MVKLDHADYRVGGGRGGVGAAPQRGLLCALALRPHQMEAAGDIAFPRPGVRNGVSVAGEAHGLGDSSMGVPLHGGQLT